MPYEFMNELNKNSYKFIDSISPTEENAKAIQKLTLDDVTRAGFKDPTALANPENPEKLQAQLDKLTDHPDQYSGFTNEAELVAFMKATEWLRGDEAPFVQSYLAKQRLRLEGKLSGPSMQPKAFGVFGLNIDIRLQNRERDDIYYFLLNHAIGQAALYSAEVINIVLNDKDPVTPIAKDLGFRPLGSIGEAAGAPGLEQQRYQRPIE